MIQPKVSIVIPVYNVEKYLRQCLDSVIHQTLTEIEIICVNDGSTDQSLAILQEYAVNDRRVKIIDKANSGYGHSMNCGFAAAIGEYIGIVESDDYAEPDMFETLYNAAKQYELDVAKAGYFLYYTQPEERNEKVEIVFDAVKNKTICPCNSFDNPHDMVRFFNIGPNIWSAIYRNEFIKINNITFNETPGASYQDTSFNFKVWACAERVRVLPGAYLHYRQDNANSSVNAKGKIYCVCDEYAEINRFLTVKPEQKMKLESMKNRLKYDTYLWNYYRLVDAYRAEFIIRAADEFRQDLQAGTLQEQYFTPHEWQDIMKLVANPEEYHTDCMVEQNWKQYEKILIQRVPHDKLAKILSAAGRKLYFGICCCKNYGLRYTWKRICN